MKKLLNKLENNIDIKVTTSPTTEGPITSDEVTTIVDDALLDETNSEQIQNDLDETTTELEVLSEAVENLQTYKSVVTKYDLTPDLLDLIHGSGVGTLLMHFTTSILPSSESLSHFTKNEVATEQILLAFEEAERGVFKKMKDVLLKWWKRFVEWVQSKASMMKNWLTSSKAKRKFLDNITDEQYTEMAKVVEVPRKYVLDIAQIHNLVTGGYTAGSPMYESYEKKIKEFIANAKIIKQHNKDVVDETAYLFFVERGMIDKYDNVGSDYTTTIRRMGYGGKKDLIDSLKKVDDWVVSTSNDMYKAKQRIEPLAREVGLLNDDTASLVIPYLTKIQNQLISDHLWAQRKVFETVDGLLKAIGSSYREYLEEKTTD